jgi:hypothetical protein
MRTNGVELTAAAAELLVELRAVAARGWIPASHQGPRAVGMTLLEALGISHTSAKKPTYHGIVVTARRAVSSSVGHRVNLFAQVPNWSLSACRSSAEIVQKYGYNDENGCKRLYCTVRSRQPNGQGLVLEVDEQSHVVHELFAGGSDVRNVATWELTKLEARLQESHPQSMWVIASCRAHDGKEWFQYRKALYSPRPFAGRMARLLHEGTVSIDHLISAGPSGCKEKGPLFKLSPRNISALFPKNCAVDLLSVR